MRAFSGIVLHGSKRAAELGFPTINIEVDAPSGIFAAIVRIGEAEFRAAAFGDPSRRLLEAHVLDASGEWYGARAEIELVRKIRETQRYESDELLKAAIASDVAEVRAYFSHV